MNIPIDIMDILNVSTDIDAARKVPVRVCIYMDPTAPDDIRRFVQEAFSSDEPNALVTIESYPEEPVDVAAGTDLAVMVAAFSEHTGRIASSLRASGIPVLTVTTMPDIVGDMARASGYELLQDDIVAPERLVDGGVLPLSDDFNSEPYPLTIDREQSLLAKMGAWVVDVFRDKRLAFALCFQFVRRPLAVDSINSTSIQNAGIGLVAIIPGADMPIMTANQAKMMLQIAAAYGQKLGAARIKELAAIVGGGFACRTVARQLVSVVPGWGWAVKAGIGYSGTLAMGYATIAYFDQLVGNGRSMAEAAAAAKAEAARVAEIAGSSSSPREAVTAVAKSYAQRAAAGVQNAAKGAVPQIQRAVSDIASQTGVDPASAAKAVIGSIRSTRKK